MHYIACIGIYIPVPVAMVINPPANQKHITPAVNNKWQHVKWQEIVSSVSFGDVFIQTIMFQMDVFEIDIYGYFSAKIFW